MRRDERTRSPRDIPAHDSGVRVRPAHEGAAQSFDSNAADARISPAADIRPKSDAPGGGLGSGAVDLTAPQRERFDALYRDHFDFVFRNLRRMGVPSASTDDALQDVYLAALRHIADLREGSHEKAWLFAIAMRVASNHRRAQRRRGVPAMLSEERLEATQPGPFDLAAREQARMVLHEFLESLEDNRRAVFVLSELEQLSAPEIAHALSANLNTVYSWQRLARAEFVSFLAKRGGGTRRG